MCNNSKELAREITYLDNYTIKVYYLRHGYGTEVGADIYHNGQLFQDSVWDGNLSVLSIEQTCKEIINKNIHSFLKAA